MQTYPTGYAESHHIAEQIFREILPRHGMAVREEQIALCHEVLDTLYNKEISLCEAGVGTGKTLAYLVGCILWQMNRPERMKLPIVISTSSVALQDAILTEYLPDLSAVLLDEGIITAPITAVVRKGKERFVCDARLAERASLVQPSRKRQTNSLNIAAHILDMDHIPELSRYDRCRICVPQSCPRDCFMRLDCRYQQYLRDSMKPDIQICNHNYLLADASHRLEDRPLLLRSYQALVVDEAHKLPDAARQMYTETLSSRAMDELCLLLQQAHYKDFARQLRTTFLTLSFSCTQGFSKLRRKVSEPFVLTPFRRAALIDCIREEIFLMPDETPIDLLRILIWYDWEHEGVLQLATSRTANTPPGKTVSPIIYSEQLPLNRLLLDWADQKHSLSVRKITRADYLEWMLQWPPRLP